MQGLPDVINTDRLFGRRFLSSDLDYVAQTDSDMRIQASVFGRTFSRDESKERLGRWLQIEADTGLGFYLFTLPDGTVVGHAGLFPSRSVPGEIEVGYILLAEHWHHGYATEMTQAFLRHAFDDAGLERIIAVTGPTNVASRHVMEKCGMQFETEFLINGTVPAVRYAIGRERA